MRISWERTDKAVNAFGKAVVRQAKGNLSRQKANASRTLHASIRYVFKDGLLRFMMETYGAFLDKGVSGTGKLWLSKTKSMPVAYNKSEGEPEFKFKPSKRAIGGTLKGWLRIRGIPLSAEFPIRRSIHARGIAPRRFFSNAFKSRYQKFSDEIERAVTADVNKQIDNILKN